MLRSCTRHSERSEESTRLMREILRFAQDDKLQSLIDPVIGSDSPFVCLE